MENGIDRIGEYDGLFRGKRLGLITAPTGLDASGRAAVDVLHERYGLAALFSPEHGVRGDADAGAPVADSRDTETGVPVYSLYRKESKRLTEEMLAQVDAVVYDIQDVGARYYTFLYTMLYAVEDCAKAGKTMIVLDRADPLDGETTEGNLLREEYRSFVGGYPLCMRYGLTAGEVARMADRREKWGCDLHVVPCKGWRRSMQFPDYGSVWVPPSPNIPRFETALLYPGTCLFEGTNVSEGRGTASPFETVGAPFVRAPGLAREMNRKKLPGVWFRPVYFVPSASKHRGEPCSGVQIHVTDRRAVRPVETGVRLLCEIRRECGEFSFLPPVKGHARRMIDLLSGDGILGGENCDPDRLLGQYEEESARFRDASREYRIYE